MITRSVREQQKFVSRRMSFQEAPQDQVFVPDWRMRFSTAPWRWGNFRGSD
jgi:hypothetical protein